MISGATRLFAIIGDPVTQARSPEVLNKLFLERGVDAVMVPLHVAGADFAAALSGLAAIGNLDGVVVTVPHKLAANRLLATRSHRAEIAGAANVLRRCAGGWEGDLLDGEGFVTGLQKNGVEPRGRRCAIVGAGGAGAAIALALCDRVARSVSVWDTDEDRAASLARRLAGRGSAVKVALPGSEADLVVNATPLGMAPDDPLPIEVTSLGQHAVVADVIMKPPVTPLLREAARRGHKTVEGGHMLDGQADLIWRYFGLPEAVAGRPQ